MVDLFPRQGRQAAWEGQRGEVSRRLLQWFGVLFAIGLGGIVMFVERLFGIDVLSEEVYFISDLPTQVRLTEVLQIGGLAIFLSVLATLYPATSASIQPPVGALRHE